ncbi:MAG TPA: sugar phosphate nucleotidyltransferase [Longimicrobiaceae bacterium]|nr:sugar phosphate nucleotidyltransferase [Longimicrobiaceae bacterium]
MNLKAVISTAGFGSRFFPLTIAVNKSLLPILNRPVIDYLVSELLPAGVRDIAFVTLPGDDQIRRYFEKSDWIERYLRDRKWEEKYEPVKRLYDRLADVRFEWIEQPVDGNYGTAIPPLLARDWIGDSDWFLLSGDDVVLRADGGSDLADLVRDRDKAGVPAGLQVTEVPRDRVSRYGIIRTRKHGAWDVLDGAVEKPSPENAPSNLASISRFLLKPDFFRTLEDLDPDPQSGEYQSIAALITYAADHPVLVHKIAGEYHDCGQPSSWLDANNAAARIFG